MSSFVSVQNVQASKAEITAYLSKTLNYLAHIRISDTVVE